MGREIKYLDQWQEAVDECGPFNLRHLHLLVFVAETRGWVDAARDLRQTVDLLEALDECERQGGTGWSTCPPPPPCGFSWGVFDRK